MEKAGPNRKIGSNGPREEKPTMTMKIPLQTRALLLILVSGTALLAQVDAREVIRRAVAADERNWKVARNYTFSERVNLRYLDSQGRLRSEEAKIHDVMLLDGSPYRRLVARDDRPLPPAEEKKEQELLARNTAERREETAAQRAQRLAEHDRRSEWQRDAWRELPEAFDFRLCAEDVGDVHSPYVIGATPRPGYQPRSPTGKLLAHLKGKLWVDRQDFHLLKAEVEVVDTIAVGLFLVRVAQGSRAALEQSLVNDEVWLPRQVQAFVSVRLGLLKVLRIEQQISYSKCREFQADSPIISQTQVR
jgi:hypothetical protein